MLTTRLTELVGCRLPLQVAGMPGVSTPALVAAVANAGGLAMLPTAGSPLALVESALDEVLRSTPQPFGVNFLIPFLDREVLELVSPRVRMVEFFYGDPDASLVEIVHRAGALACWQVGSTSEARLAVDCGCDVVIAQGVQAGGHVRGTVTLLALLAEVLDAVHVPVIAAGGIGTARAMAAVLAAGASGVRIGTRFVAAAESGAHPSYVAALIRSQAEDTVLTDAFSVMWPDAPHRVLRSCVERAQALDADVAGETMIGGVAYPIPRLAVPVPTRETTGHVDAMALYAGESVSAVERVEPAADIVRELCDGAAALLERAAAEVTAQQPAETELELPPASTKG
ncbi:MAG TPA: nitronate monooxygenase [Candidatus Limnocylindrales bacterium]|nr:nitronate monooxygenase [Candidatus Limnocylindrales bacterium]